MVDYTNAAGYVVDSKGRRQFQDRDKANGVSGTSLVAVDKNMDRNTLAETVLASGQVLDGNNDAQLTLAILALSGLSLWSQGVATAINGYDLGAAVRDAAGRYWRSTSAQNLTVPGANGAAWVDLFSGYLSEADASAEFVSSNYGAQVGDYNSRSLFMRGDNPVYGYAGPNGVVWLSLTTVAQTQAETAARQAADTALQNNLDAEAEVRLTGDNTLHGYINDESQARAAAVTTLTTNLTAETAARENADTTLQTNINTEVAARVTGDNYLNSIKANLGGGNHLTGNQIITDGSQFATTGVYTAVTGNSYDTALIKGSSPNGTVYQSSLREYAGSHYSILNYVYDGSIFHVYEMPTASYNGGRLICPAGTGAVLSDLPTSGTIAGGFYTKVGSVLTQTFKVSAANNIDTILFPMAFSGLPAPPQITPAELIDCDVASYNLSATGFTIDLVNRSGVDVSITVSGPA